MSWRGADARALIERAGPRPEATHLLAHCYGGYTTNMPLSDVIEHPALVAHMADGAPLEPDHGGPARLLVPHLYLWKSAKWIQRLELLDHDQLGFWERNGYHHRGDPWREERHSVDDYVARTAPAPGPRRRARARVVAPRAGSAEVDRAARLRAPTGSRAASPGTPASAASSRPGCRRTPRGSSRGAAGRARCRRASGTMCSGTSAGPMPGGGEPRGRRHLAGAHRHLGAEAGARRSRDRPPRPGRGRARSGPSGGRPADSARRACGCSSGSPSGSTTTNSSHPSAPHLARPALGQRADRDVPAPSRTASSSARRWGNSSRLTSISGVALLPVAQHHREDAQRRRGRHRHVEPPDLELERLAHMPAGTLSVPQGGARLAEQLLARCGESHAPRQPLEQLAAELALQRPDLLGQRRLGHEQVLGCRGERPALCDGHEVLELPEVHKHKYCLS